MHLISVRPVLVIHLPIVSFFLSEFMTNILNVFLKAAMPATCLCHLTLLNLIVTGVFNDEYISVLNPEIIR